MKYFRQFLTMVCLICAVLPAAAQQESGVVTVDATNVVASIHPFVYGSNMNLYTIIPASLMPQAQAMGLRFMRFGGGDTDRQDLRNNIIDLFVLQSRAIGAEPLLSVRLLGGTPEAAANIVRYTNQTRDYNIRYWSIGNEPNLFTALMSIDSYPVERFVTEWRAIALAMLEVDPDIIFVGPDITQYIPLDIVNGRVIFHPASDHADENGKDWLVEFLKANGDLIDYVGIHRYPFPTFGNRGATVDELRTINDEWDVTIPLLRQIIRETAGRDIPLAVTEINSNSANSIGGEASLDSHFNAIWLADALGRLIVNGVEIVAYWDLQGSAGRGWGLLGSFDVRPTYYTYLMYTHFGSELLTADSSVPLVNAYAALREDGQLSILLVNLGDDPQRVPLVLEGFTATTAEVHQFSPNQTPPVAFTLDSAESVEVPGRSITVVVLPPAN